MVKRELARQARAVLDRNWLGAATRPAPRLYPHQWSWDSGFIATGYAHYQQKRAMTEMRSLFAGQWENGMLPHIIFNPETMGYFPGPEFWQTDRSAYAPASISTSGIVQPPNHASAIWHIYQLAADKAAAKGFLEQIYPALVSWHEFLYRDRDADGSGLVYIRHPWESGQDNSPIWDLAMSRVEIDLDMPPKYERVDNTLLDASERPSQEEYDVYAQLVNFAYEHDYDEARIRADCQFLIQDVLFNALLVQSNQALAEIAGELGEDPNPFLKWRRSTLQAMNEKLWSEEHGIYFDYDLREGERIEAHVAAGFTPLYAGIPSEEQAARILGRLNSGGFCPLNEMCWAVPSYDKQAPGFSPEGYWRGPIWININWLIYMGLMRYGFDDYAEKVRHAIIELPEERGFFEYFHPDTGHGHGSHDFSWTAALVLDLLYEEDGLPESHELS